MSCFLSSGGRTRTSDLWVMSPTSYQLLHSAIKKYKDKGFIRELQTYLKNLDLQWFAVPQ